MRFWLFTVILKIADTIPLSDLSNCEVARDNFCYNFDSKRFMCSEGVKFLRSH